jgi:hypothetical protein
VELVPFPEPARIGVFSRVLVASAFVSSRVAATAISGEGVLGLTFMAGVAYVTAAIARLVGLEVVEALRAALRQRPTVTVMRIIAIIDVSVKAARAVKPGTGSKEHAAYKPIGPVVAVRSTVIGGIVEVSVRTRGSGSDVYANGDLSLGWRCRA